jgi:tetratricopeptide (TPR) repeat protein
MRSSLWTPAQLNRTQELARGFGARVFDFAWVDSFAAARNESLRHATGKWTFWMDADDRLDESNRSKLGSLLASLNGANAAYAMKCLCLPDPISKVATEVDHVRLFRNHPDVCWEFRVHEQILPSLRQLNTEVRWSDVVIHHVGSQDLPLRRRKLERDWRLLRLEDSDRPNHPFTLFNLGCIAQELGNAAEAIQLFQRSLNGSQPGDSIVRKLHALLIQCHRQLGQLPEALEACEAGRQHYPADAELLFQEGLLHLSMEDRASAEICFLRVLSTPASRHFRSVDTGVRGYKARTNLATIYRDQGRLAEAEAQWRSALAEASHTVTPTKEGRARVICETEHPQLTRQPSASPSQGDHDPISA